MSVLIEILFLRVFFSKLTPSLLRGLLVDFYCNKYRKCCFVSAAYVLGKLMQETRLCTKVLKHLI